MTAERPLPPSLPWLRPRTQRAVRGVAWAPGWTVPFLKEDFGATTFFHSATTAPRWWPDGGIPIVRTVEHGRAGRFGWVRQLAALVDAGYGGFVIFGNEPDRPDQDAAAVESYAWQYRLAAAWLDRAGGPRFSIREPRPRIDLVVGNAISATYTAELLRRVTLRPRDVLGIHIYQEARHPLQPGWLWPGAWIERLQVLAGAAWPGQVWVTEYGVEKAWELDVARRFVDEVETCAEVTHAFAFTTHPGTAVGHAGRFGFYTEVGSRELTTAGEAFREATKTRK